MQACSTIKETGRRKLIYEVSCKISTLDIFKQLRDQESKNKLFTTIFKEPIKMHEEIAIKKWAKKNKKMSLPPLLLLANLSSTNSIPSLPSSIHELAKEGKKAFTKIEIGINQFRQAEEEFNGLVEPIKKACVANEDRSFLLEKADQVLKTMFLTDESESATDFSQDLLTLAKYSQSRGCLDISKVILSHIPFNDSSEYFDEVYFRNVWQFILTGNYQDATSFLGKNKQVSDRVEASSRNMFWTAHIFENTNQNDLAKDMYKRIVESFPLEFYGILAFKKMKAISKDFTNFHTKQFETEKFVNLNTLRPSTDINTRLTKINIWSQVKAEVLLSEEVSNINFDAPEIYFSEAPKNISEKVRANIRNSIVLNLAQILSSNSMDLEVFKLIQMGKSKYSIQMDKTFLELIFPVKYKDLVWSESSKNQLDPVFTLGLIRQESAFNPYAQSPVGARGLMQIMPTTAKHLKKGTQKNELFSPEKNVSLGTKYLKLLTNKFDSNLVFVLAAYNAGDHRVAQWIKEIFRGEDDFLKIVESIPFTETNGYVKLIYRNIYFYKMLYGEQQDTHYIGKIFDLDLNPSSQETNKI